MSRPPRTTAISRWAAGALALASALTAGCSHDYWARFRILTDADPAVVIDEDNVQIPVGHAVAVRVTAMKDDERLDADTDIDLQSLRPDLLGVDRSARTAEFVIFGSRVGQTEIDVFFESEWVDTLPATVLEASR